MVPAEHFEAEKQKKHNTERTDTDESERHERRTDTMITSETL